MAESRIIEAQHPWAKHPVRTLHGCVETLANALKGYLPWPEELRDANVRRLEALVKDTVERADACMTIIEHGERRRPARVASTARAELRQMLADMVDGDSPAHDAKVTRMIELLDSIESRP